MGFIHLEKDLLGKKWYMKGLSTYTQCSWFVLCLFWFRKMLLQASLEFEMVYAQRIQVGMWQAMAYVRASSICLMLLVHAQALIVSQTLIQASSKFEMVNTGQICIITDSSQTLARSSVCRAFLYMPNYINLFLGSLHAKKCSYKPLWSPKRTIHALLAFQTIRLKL